MPLVPQADERNRFAASPFILSTTVVEGLAITASGATDAIETLGLSQISFTITVTDLVGDTQINMGLEESDDDIYWQQISTSLIFTADGSQRLTSIPLTGKSHRFFWSMTGSSPSAAITISSSLRDISPVSLPPNASRDDTLTAVYTEVFNLNQKVNVLGQSDMGASMPVVIASDQSAVTVDNSGVNQPVVGIGTAGTPDGGVVTVQGDSSGTPVPVSGTVTAITDPNPSVAEHSAEAAPAYATLVGGKNEEDILIPLKISFGRLVVDASEVTQGVEVLNDIQIEGMTPSGSADSVNPVKTGGKFSSTVPTFSNGDLANTQANRNGATSVQFRNTFARVTGNTTSTVKSGAGVLHSIIIGDNQTGGTATVYDNTAGSGTVIFKLQFGLGVASVSYPGPFSTGPLGIEFGTGLTVVTAGSTANDITFVYQ